MSLYKQRLGATDEHSAGFSAALKGEPMGKIVGGFWMPHDPVMFVAPDAPPLAQATAWGALRQPAPNAWRPCSRLR
jgi:hypothetical protein